MSEKESTHSEAGGQGQTGQARRLLYAGLALAVISFLVFSPLLHAGFINYDDPAYVTANPHVLSGFTWAGIKWAFTTVYLGAYYPLTLLSHTLDCQLFGTWAGGHHLTSILIHIGSVLLLFAFLVRATKAFWRSALVALLFAIHPLHVESVAWIAERKDVLSTFFLMLMLFLYAGYAKKPGWQRYIATLAAYLLGLMSKAMLVTAPFLLIVLDFWPFRRFSLEGPSRTFEGDDSRERNSGLRPLGRLVLEKVPFFALSAVFSAVTLLAQKDVGALGGYPMKARLINALAAYGSYLGKTLVPVNLAVLYPFRYEHLPIRLAVLTAALILLMLILGIRLRFRAPYILAGSLWYLGMLVPVIGIVEIGSLAMADRYTYVPIVGLFLVASWGLADWVEYLGNRARLVACIVLALWFSMLGIMAYRQSGYWKNSLALWGHTLAVTEKNPHAENQYALALMHRGDWAEAEGHLKTAISLLPDYANAWNNLALDAIMQKKAGLAVGALRQAAGLRPRDLTPRIVLARLLSREGKTHEALAVWREVLQLDPSNVEAQRALESSGH